MKKSKQNEPAGVKDIARRANVSIGTVDRVLHNREGVSEKTRARINKIIRELNYQPNILARRLASRKTLQFDILIPHISNESDYWQAPLLGIIRAEAELKQFGINIGKFFFDQNDKDSFVKQAELILKRKADGVLLAPFFLDESTQFTHACSRMQIPFVFINSDIPDQPSLCYIGPDLFHSGYAGGQLTRYCIPEKSKILVVNVSKEIKNQQHNRLLRKEEGFRAYFKDNNRKNPVVKTDIRKTDQLSIEKNMSDIFQQHPDIRSIFVTNSRVGSVASFLEKNNMKNLLVTGYDFIEDNISFLKKGWIDFLICHKPVEQGYRGIMSLYQHLVLKAEVEKTYFMPVDIVLKENCAFYRN
ncbi:MAG: substrate-binding domain-containing protein [Chitinophagaceae bacterium]|nr:substrate-binding domain-containing protein [Chitinophagaceae bacterium]